MRHEIAWITPKAEKRRLVSSIVGNNARGCARNDDLDFGQDYGTPSEASFWFAMETVEAALVAEALPWLRQALVDTTHDATDTRRSRVATAGRSSMISTDTSAFPINDKSTVRSKVTSRSKPSP